MTTSSLADLLAALGLRATAAQLNDLIALATKQRWSLLRQPQRRPALPGGESAA
jgi:hypothetical protein